MIFLFTHRKGLVTTFILPYLTIYEKMATLPRLSVAIRLFKTKPNKERHFYNYVYSNFTRFASRLSL